MTLGEKFSLLAQRLIRKFTAGSHTFKKLVSEEYDPTTGAIVTVYDDYVALNMTQEDIKNQFEKDMYKGSVIFTLSRLDLGDVTIPEANDMVVDPDGQIFRVKGVRYDQYKSRYVLGTEKEI
jgi:hypothetical protein